MVPFLLPPAIVLMVALAIALVLFLRFYQVPRPGTALVVHRAGAEPALLLGRGAFVRGAERVDTLELRERTLALELEATFRDGSRRVRAEITLRPSDAAADVLALSQQLPRGALQDDDRLEAALAPELSEAVREHAASRPVEAALSESARPALAASVGARAPLFRVLSCALREV